MSEQFDPYHQWLGIAPEEQPPHHYRLLGLSPFEDNADVIENSADQRMGFLRTFQTGKHSKDSQRLLNEVAKAQVCLLDPERKKQYDARLRKHLDSKPAPTAKPGRKVVDDTPPELAAFLQQTERRGKTSAGRVAARSTARKTMPLWVKLSGAGGAAVAMIIVVGLIIHLSGTSPDAQPGAKVAKVPDDPSPRPPGKDTKGVTSTLAIILPAEDRESVTVLIDQKPVDMTKTVVEKKTHLELTAACGTHTLELRKPGFEPVRVQVDVQNGKMPGITPHWIERLPTTGHGLAGEYFKDPDLQDLVAKRVDPKLQYFFEGCPHEHVPADGFSIRWTGWLKAPKAGQYHFVVHADDGVRIWLDDKKVLDEWGNLYKTCEMQLDLTDQPHKLRVEQRDDSGRAMIALNWFLDGETLETAIAPEAFFLDRQTAQNSEVPESVLRKLPSADRRSQVAGKPIDLLSLVDTNGDVVRGHWWFDGDSLVCGYSDKPATIRLPIAPPNQYDLTVSLERVIPSDASSAILIGGGQPFEVTLDGRSDKGPVSGIKRIDGKDPSDNETRFQGPVLPPNELTTIHYRVRNAGDGQRVVCEAGGKTIVDWTGDLKRFSRELDYFPDTKMLGLGVYESSFRISKVALTPLADAGSASPGSTSSSVAAKAKQPPPAMDVVTTLLEKVRDENEKACAEKLPQLQAALAAELLQQSRRDDTSPELRYVLLREAGARAARGGNTLVAMLAIDELDAHFDDDVAALKVEALANAVRQAKTAFAVNTLVDAVHDTTRSMEDPEQFNQLNNDVFRNLLAISAKVGGPALLKQVQNQRRIVQAQRDLCRQAVEARTTLKQSPDDPAASAAIGRFEALVREDWQRALPLLAKAGDDNARQLLAEPNDTEAQFQLGHSLWEDSQKNARKEPGLAELCRRASVRWYQKALPNLDSLQAATARERLKDGGEAVATVPFSLNMGGLAGRELLAPEKVTGDVVASGGYATFHGKASLDFPTILATSFVHELHMVFSKPLGQLVANYGEPHEGVRITIVWIVEQNKYRCRFHHYRGGTVWWGGERLFDPGEPIKLTVYVDENWRRSEFEGRSALGISCRSTDLDFRMTTRANTALIVSRCQFRPWTDEDATAQGRAKPVATITCVPAERALQLAQQNLGLADQPKLGSEESFLVATTGTPMQWIPPGSFTQKFTVAFDDKTETREFACRISRGFWIGRHEISLAEWTSILPTGVGAMHYEGSPFLAVDGVSWEQASQFCMALSQVEKRAGRLPKGYIYRLPTEAEWEYAALGGGKNDFAVASGKFWAAETSQHHPHEVAQSTPNAWGLYDMQGNVAEWCLDRWIDCPTPMATTRVDPVTRATDTKGDFVLRGGAWWQRTSECSCRTREKHINLGGPHRGFRIVLAPTSRDG